MESTPTCPPVSNCSFSTTSSAKHSSRELHPHISNSCPVLSSILRTFQIFFYALRPGFVRIQVLTQWHLYNLIAQLIFDVLLVQAFGYRPLLYLLLSSFFAGSLHPCAAHFIAEHYLWDGLEQETYSYYGPLNRLAYNVRFLLQFHCKKHITITIVGRVSQRAPRLPLDFMDATSRTPPSRPRILRHHTLTSIVAHGHD